MVLSFSNALWCNLPNGMSGNRSMIEPTTEADSLIVEDLFSKTLLTFKTIDSVFSYVIEIGIVAGLNKT